jgi:hypothetical protein
MKTLKANFNPTKAADSGCPTAPQSSNQISPLFESSIHNIHQQPSLLLEDEDAVSMIISAQKGACDHSSFPWTLHTMLEDAESHGFETTVSWLPGRTDQFKVHNPDKFTREVAPLYFNSTHYKSFQRQLNIYGFVRQKHGPSKGAYTHPLLIRGNPAICDGMTRTKIKGKGQCLKAPTSSLRVSNQFSSQKESSHIASKPQHQTGKSDIFTSESRLQRMFIESINSSPTRKPFASSLFHDQTWSTDAYTTRSSEAYDEESYPLSAFAVGECDGFTSGISLDTADEIINIFGSSYGW